MRRRSGFTLVELLVVIVVIGILAAILLPAVSGVRNRAQIARVRTEIASLESAVTGFKTVYGIDPPSRIVICTRQAEWDSNPQSKGIVKRIWPQFDFSMPGGPGVAYPAAWGAPGSIVTINAGECLLFFLGGILDNYPAGAPTGFSKNPSIPFSPQGSNRQPAFMEFDVGRIKDTDASGMPEYLDSLSSQTKPYLYFSSYEGRGYRVAGPQNELPAGGTLADVYRVGTASATPGPSTASLAPQKQLTLQIISPGMDNEYGLGGVYNTNLPNNGLADRRDYDNITNFANGTLNQ